MTAAGAGWFPDPSGSGGQKYWDGQAWLVLAPDTRADILNQVIMAEKQRNPTMRVESHSPHQATMAYGDTNYLVHLVLTVFTCGFWLIVWLFLMGPTQRRVATVDPYGNVMWS